MNFCRTSEESFYQEEQKNNINCCTSKNTENRQTVILYVPFFFRHYKQWISGPAHPCINPKSNYQQINYQQKIKKKDEEED